MGRSGHRLHPARRALHYYTAAAALDLGGLGQPQKEGFCLEFGCWQHPRDCFQPSLGSALCAGRSLPNVVFSLHADSSRNGSQSLLGVSRSAGFPITVNLSPCSLFLLVVGLNFVVRVRNSVGGSLHRLSIPAQSFVDPRISINPHQT